MLMELSQGLVSALQTYSRYTNASYIMSVRCCQVLLDPTHNRDFAAKVILDLTLLHSIGCLISDDGEEILDTHLDRSNRVGLL